MLNVKDICFDYEQGAVLDTINFTVAEGEHLSVIGESGSGKSTLLKLLYGELDVNQGHIFWKDTAILGPKYNLVVGYDFMKYVAQEFDLMPYTSVEENIGKHLSNFYPEEKSRRVKELIEVVQLEPFARAKVKTLSGGQKQRVALARALAKDPEIILLDEPFSHIDNFKKQALRRSLFGYLKENNISCIVATHDKDDVLGHADKMIVLHNRHIEALNTPENLYANPRTPLVAAFFGEFNTLKPYGIVYAHQLIVVEESHLKALVEHSYFNGKNFLISGKRDSKPIYFEHHKAIKKGATVCLKVVL